MAQSPKGAQKFKESVKKVWNNAENRRKSAVQRNSATNNKNLRVPVPFVPSRCEVIQPVTDKAWYDKKRWIA